MSILAVIPARGGSKGVPRKNLRPVAGRPLIEWTIQQALDAEHDLDVVVSTDDEEIADVARAAGAEVPFLRPADLAQDTTATEPVVRHAIDELTARGRRPEAVMLLQATSPIRLPGTIDRAIAEFTASGADSMVGVVPQAPFLWWAGDDDTGPHADYDITARPRRQDLTARTLRYRETGSLYLTRTEVYEQLDNRLGGRVRLFVMDEVEGIDIDSEVDLGVADAELANLHRTAPQDIQDSPA
ncbi:N-acylneuraminate cytidylyltransferase [Knoellia remsis]|uniref:N-acylneuraminate cytidylyltransferase n=1 Tax=Knoellia remsis TaxID=407159 RepID=A0A2T0UZ53_9MICO|nr:acylneuraminate cytidylyltransferase family protein [Knoellia remsis]PRY63215.1 N-acylneuraminate cytidylyltransferase [Knoellia remsis]